MRNPEMSHPEQRKVSLEEFNLMIFQQIQYCLDQIEEVQGQLNALQNIQTQIEISRRNGCIVDCMQDMETGQLSIRTREKPQMGFVK